jgi:hypothetical protein
LLLLLLNIEFKCNLFVICIKDFDLFLILYFNFIRLFLRGNITFLTFFLLLILIFLDTLIEFLFCKCIFFFNFFIVFKSALIFLSFKLSYISDNNPFKVLLYDSILEEDNFFFLLYYLY